ncbi:T9SS type A sorting domain-containing protein [Ancylomarina sp. YFZ004]
MLRLLLVKKYLILLLALLLTSASFVKADITSCSLFCDNSYTNWQFSLNTPSDQLDDITKKDPSFYPNPVRDIVNLSNQENVTRVRVISLTGKTLIDIKIPKKTINLSHLAKGMYLINFDTKDGKRVARKLVKK